MAENKQAKKPTKVIFQIVCWVVMIIALTTSIMTVFSVVSSKNNGVTLFGYRVYVAQGDSMAKTHFQAGDVVISLYAEDTRASLTVILRGAALPQSSQNAVGGIVCRPELVESEGNLAFGLLCVNNDSIPFTLEVTAQSVEIKSN